MKVLVLGGTGAMGVALVDLLAERGDEVYVTSRSKRENKKNVTFIEGNAHDFSFLQELLKNSYDVVVDFMIYTLAELEERMDLILTSTKQYFFLSSSRVYAESTERITEDSPRLLDVCKDETYMQTREYALAKAREENLLMSSSHKNWTVIRPYITYSNIRLQLGTQEKEYWLYRALQGRSIVFSDEIVKRFTSLTYGYDVSRTMVDLIGNPDALGECIHIVTPETVKWSDILEIYLDVLEEELGHRPKVFLTDYKRGMVDLLGNHYQFKYDRLFNRSFNSEKVDRICHKDIDYVGIEEGLSRCLKEFIAGNREFRRINWKFEAFADKICGEKTSLKEIDTFKNKIKYLVFRYTPYFWLKGIK